MIDFEFADRQEYHTMEIKQIIWRRQLRAKFFPSGLFSDPAWDALLELYMSYLRSAPLSVTSACIATGAPVATGFRWLSRLQGAGLITRAGDSDDARRVQVHLTEPGLGSMSRWLEAVSAQR